MRHRTARAAVEWSYDLLDAAEQSALRSLAVFVGGFDAAAANAVGQGLSLDMLARLVDKSLVAVIESPRGATRYKLLETIRAYAHEVLLEAGELDDARKRHLHHFLTLCDRAQDEWLSSGRLRLINDLDGDYENVRAAAEWAAEHDPCACTRLLGGARDLFFRFGQADGLRLVRLVLERCSVRDRRRVEALITGGQLAITLADFQAARGWLAEAGALSAELDERALHAWTRFFEGLAEVLSGALQAGREHLEASRKLHHELGIAAGEGRSISVLGGTYVMAGDTARGKELLEAAFSIYRAEDDRWGQGQCHTFLGIIADDTAADRSVASTHYREALDMLRPSRDATLLPVALIGQAGLVADRDPAKATRLLGAASAIRARVGGEFGPSTEGAWTASGA